jgi:hypothetical protein
MQTHFVLSYHSSFLYTAGWHLSIIHMLLSVLFSIQLGFAITSIEVDECNPRVFATAAKWAMIIFRLQSLPY